MHHVSRDSRRLGSGRNARRLEGGRRDTYRQRRTGPGESTGITVGGDGRRDPEQGDRDGPEQGHRDGAAMTASPGSLRFPRLFSELPLREHVLKNRIVFPPTCPTWVSSPQSAQFNELAAPYYEERASGGVGLIIIGGTHVHRSSPSPGCGTTTRYRGSRRSPPRFTGTAPSSLSSSGIPACGAFRPTSKTPHTTWTRPGTR